MVSTVQPDPSLMYGLTGTPHACQPGTTHMDHGLSNTFWRTQHSENDSSKGHNIQGIQTRRRKLLYSTYGSTDRAVEEDVYNSDNDYCEL